MKSGVDAPAQWTDGAGKEGAGDGYWTKCGFELDEVSLSPRVVDQGCEGARIQDFLLQCGKNQIKSALEKTYLAKRY